MTTYEKANLMVQGIVGIAIVATFLVYWKMLQAMKEATIGQNVLKVITDLFQTPNMRDALAVVRRDLPKKELPWTPDEEKAAQLVGTRFDLLGILIKGRFIPSGIFLENWGGSIISCREALHPYISKLQADHRNGHRYFDDFDWLYSKACEHLGQPNLIFGGRAQQSAANNPDDVQ